MSSQGPTLERSNSRAERAAVQVDMERGELVLVAVE